MAVADDGRPPREPERKLGPDGFEAWARALLWTSTLKPFDRFVALLIGTRDWYGTGHGCTLAVPNLARLAGVAEGTVKKALHRLTDLGLITVAVRLDAKGAQTSSSRRVNRARCVCLPLVEAPGIVLDPGVKFTARPGEESDGGQVQEQPGAGDWNRPTKSLQVKAGSKKPSPTNRLSASPTVTGVAKRMSEARAVDTVLRYWRRTMQDRTRRSEWRTKLIRARLGEAGGDVSRLLYAVDGAVVDAWDSVGRYANIPRCKLETALRDRLQVERLYRLASDRQGVHPYIRLSGRDRRARRLWRGEVDSVSVVRPRDRAAPKVSG